MKTRTGILTIAAIAAAAMFALMTPAKAQTEGDVRAAYHADQEAVGVGGGILTEVGDSNRWKFNPNVEIAFADDDDDQMSLNGDFRYDITRDSDVAFWMGAGPALLVNELGDDSDTDVGLNLLTGIGASRGDVRPFGQLRGVVADQSEVVLAGGIHF
jgi:hypothetical protein